MHPLNPKSGPRTLPSCQPFREIVFEANRFYKRPDPASIPVLQLSYNDLEGRYPWEEGYATPELQPRPGAFRA